jgi:adenosylmethionine-8-amino-7-oxononanoate aminotransferase
VELNNDHLRESAREHLLLQFAQNGAYGPGGQELLVLDRGEGPYVFDVEGRRYLDGYSSLCCAQIGYSYGAEIAEAIRMQLERLPFNTTWSTAHRPAIELAERLVNLAPGDIGKAFFTNSGAEAVEAAWKIARLYHVANGETTRCKAIARRNAFHGATLGALALTGAESYKAPFGSPALPVLRVSNTNAYRRPECGSDLSLVLLAEIEQAILAEGPETVAMLIAEPVQHAGGCLVPPPGYWTGLREICDRFGVVLVADEVITGFGRLGEWFGVTRYGGAPDIITLAKGLTSAYAPMGATLVANRIAEPLYRDDRILYHGSTFGGHPASAVVTLKNIEIFERDGVLENVRANESYLKDRLEELRSIPIVGDIRGAGYHWAVELVRDAAGSRFNRAEREELVRGYMPGRLLRAGIIARADDRGDAVLQIAPPLVCDQSTLGDLVDAMAEVLTDAHLHMHAADGKRTGATTSRPRSTAWDPPALDGDDHVAVHDPT